jgi:hypothetical protein
MDLTPQRQMQQQEDDLRRLQEEVRLQESQPASPRDDADGARWARGATTAVGTGALPMDLAAAAASRATGLIAAAGAPDADYHKRHLAMAAGSHAQHAQAAGKAAESSGAGSLEQVMEQGALVSLLGDVRSLLLQVMNSSSASVGGGLGVGSANGAGGSIPRQHLLRPAQAVIQLAGGSGPGQHRAAQQIHQHSGDHSGTAWHRMRDHDDALGHRRERWRERWRPWFACFGV